MFRLTILPRAKRDIDRNADWWAEHHSTEQAVKWADAIYAQLETLRTFPESNALSAENDEFPYQIRDKLVGVGAQKRYRAVFTIKDDEVFVLAVRAAEEKRLTSSDLEA